MVEIIPITQKIHSQPFVATGVIAEKDGKFVMVKEGPSKTGKKEIGLWNRPGGWLDLNEDVLAGAVREFKEETGLDVELIGFLGVYCYYKKNQSENIHGILLEFAGKLKSTEIKIETDEILEARWFNFDEIKKLELRRASIITQIEDYLAGRIYHLEIIKPLLDYTQK